MKLTVTGGTGFLGRRIVADARAHGHEVVAVSRGQSVVSDMDAEGHFAADICDTDRMRSAFNGCEVVVHCAALSSDWGPNRNFERANVEGTRSVVLAAERAGVRRLVHVSSTSVYFEFADRYNLSEDARLPTPANAYARTKREAEGIVRRFGGEVFIMRPRGLFGAGDPHLLPKLLDVHSRGGLPLLRDGRAQVDLTELGVAADAVMAMVHADAENAGTYNISQGEPIAVRTLVERLLLGLGHTPRWRELPMGLAIGAARFLEAVASLDPRGKPPLVTAYALGLFAFGQTLDLRRARESLGWRPPIGLDEALERTIAAARSVP